MTEPQQQITRVNEYASAFEAFIHEHAIVTALLVATICSWTLTAAVKPWFSGPHRARNLRAFDCFAAGAIAALMLWGLFGVQVWIGLVLLVGSASPIAYWLVTGALCWKWPALRQYLTLRELTVEEPAPPVSPPGDMQ